MTSHQSEPLHRPVLVAEVVKLLIADPNGAYLDLTAGGGGHLRALAARLGKDSRLYGIDRDAEAVARATRVLEGTVQFRKIEKAAFGDLSKVAPLFEEKMFDGILLDLGLSSYQLESAQRGFSFRHDGPLDMRFDRSSGASAADLIDRIEEKQLARLIRDFGEEKQAARIARTIVMERQKLKIDTTRRLTDVLLPVLQKPHQKKSLARVFQALRIAVNRELDQLTEVLPAAADLLAPGGRLAVISYHSLEDRLTKRFFQAEASGRCVCPSGLPVCACGAVARMKIVTRKSVVPTEAEIATNPRARSARLRVGERL